MSEPLAGVTARFPARPEGLDELHAALDRFFVAADRAGVSVGATDRAALTTAAGEIAANIVAHACRHLPDAAVVVAFRREPGHVEAHFEDPGLPCGELPPPRDPASDAIAANGVGPVPHLGIGLQLARLCVDGLEYARVLGTNHWRLVRLTRDS